MCCRRSSEFPGAVPVDRDRPSCIAWTCDLDRCPPAGLLVAESTLRFRQALSSIDQQLVTGRPRPDGRRGKLLVVGPLKTPASQALLSLPAFAVHALRAYQQVEGQRAPLRLLLVRPGEAPRPVELDLVLRTGRGTAVRPEHASRAFGAFARAAGVDAHPHLLRHSLASAMAAAREPASVIAGQLRHADGGTLASRTYVHRLPQTPPRLARLIERASAETGYSGVVPQLRGGGRDRIRTCVGEAGGFTVSPRRSPSIPTWSRSSWVTSTSGPSTASTVTWRPGPFLPVPRGLASGGAKVEGSRTPRLHRELVGVGANRDRRNAGGLLHALYRRTVGTPTRT